MCAASTSRYCPCDPCMTKKADVISIEGPQFSVLTTIRAFPLWTMVASPMLCSLVLLLLCAAAAAQNDIKTVDGRAAGVMPDEAASTQTDASLPAGPAASTNQQASTMHAWSRPNPSPAPRRPRLPPPPTKKERAARNLNRTEDTVMFVQTASYATITKDTIVLNDVGKTQWFLNRPDRKTGVVETEWVLLMLLMHQRERAINADITWVSSHGKKPRSATIMLWNPDYDSAKRRLSYSWAVLGDTANNDALLPSRGKSSSRSTLQSVSLFLDSCPSNVPFICYKGTSCQWETENTCMDFNPSVYNAELWNYKDGYQQFSCPGNWVGTVVSNACWDSHTKIESYSGSCVACHDTVVDQLCESAFPTQCANGACTNSWYPAYWPYFCNLNPTNTPDPQYNSCQCGGVLSPPSSSLKAYCNYECDTSWPWCSTLSR